MEYIKVWEPRYHDKKVLVAAWRIKGYPVYIEIECDNEYGGKYMASKEVVENSKHMIMKTKKGGEAEMVCIPFDELEKVKEDDDEETRLG